MSFLYLVNEFSKFTQTQKAIATKQNELLETFVSLNQQTNSKISTLNEQELHHVLTYGTWTNGKVN